MRVEFNECTLCRKDDRETDRNMMAYEVGVKGTDLVEIALEESLARTIHICEDCAKRIHDDYKRRMETLVRSVGV